jgi:putative transposase
MTYPLSFRRKVLAHIEEGMSKRDAARLFKISPNTLYQWLGSEELAPRQAGVERKRKIDKEKLRAHVEEFPDMYLRERAAHFGVHINAIWTAMRKLGYRKKKSGVI